MASPLTLALVGATLGAVVGWGCQHIPLRPLVTSMASGVLAWLLATLVVAFLSLQSSTENTGIAAVSVDFDRLGLVLVVSAVLAAAAHLALGHLGASFRTSPPIGVLSSGSSVDLLQRHFSRR